MRRRPPAGPEFRPNGQLIFGGDSTCISGKIDALVVGDAYSADEFTSAVDIELVLVGEEKDE